MSWREVFMNTVSPGGLSGMTPPGWWRTLRANRFAVDPRYWLRAAATTFSSLLNVPPYCVEQLRFGRRIRETPIEPPLFILGIWRSGTTHLHNLLTRDTRFAYPNMYHVLFPHTFLTTERLNRAFVNLFMPPKRLQDNVKLGMDEPQEDELAMCVLTGQSILMGMAFPRNARQYDRYLTLDGLAPDELTQWKDALRLFLQKLTLKYNRPLVLKSPGHTCRIRLLLDMFPGARFVHIHRHPFDVFRSSLHTVRKMAPAWTFQRPQYDGLEDQAIEQYRIVYDRFFEEKDLIPAGRFHEVRFTDLEADPVGQLRALYDALDLPSFDDAEPDLHAYVESLLGYKKNEYDELPESLRQKLYDAWRPSFDAWGYEP